MLYIILTQIDSLSMCVSIYTVYSQIYTICMSMSIVIYFVCLSSYHLFIHRRFIFIFVIRYQPQNIIGTLRFHTVNGDTVNIAGKVASKLLDSNSMNCDRIQRMRQICSTSDCFFVCVHHVKTEETFSNVSLPANLSFTSEFGRFTRVWNLRRNDQWRTLQEQEHKSTLRWFKAMYKNPQPFSTKTIWYSPLIHSIKNDFCRDTR